jgi:hypothetical protein
MVPPRPVRDEGDVLQLPVTGGSAHSQSIVRSCDNGVSASITCSVARRLRRPAPSGPHEQTFRTERPFVDQRVELLVPLVRVLQGRGLRLGSFDVRSALLYNVRRAAVSNCQKVTDRDPVREERNAAELEDLLILRE